MAIDSALTPYVPKGFYTDSGQLSVPGSTSTADAEATASTVAAGIQAFVKDMPDAQKASFMAAVNMADPSTFAPDGKVPTDLSARLTVLEKSVTAFRAMLVSGNDVNLLARVMIEQIGQQRHEAVVDRQMLRQLAQAQLLGAAQEMNNQADTMMSGALQSLIISCVTAAVSAGMAIGAGLGKISSLKSELSATKSMGEAESGLAEMELGKIGSQKKALDGEPEAGNVTVKVNTESPSTTKPPATENTGKPLGKNEDVELPGSEQPKGTVSKTEKDNETQLTERTAADLTKQKFEAKETLIKAEITKTKFDMVGQSGQTVGRLGESIANYVNTMAQKDVKNSEADQKRDEALAEQLNAAADLKKAMSDSLDDMIKQLIVFVKDLQDAKSERMATFTRI